MAGREGNAVGAAGATGEELTREYLQYVGFARVLERVK